MAYYLSPLVEIKERDLSVSVPAVATTIAGIVGKFRWGPAYQIMQLTQDQDLIDIFYEPNDDVYEDWFSVYNFLQYANDIRVVRALDDATAKNAGLKIQDKDAGAPTPQSNADYIGNDDDAENYTPSFGGDDKWHIFAKYPGARGTDITVAIANYTDFSTANIRTGVTFASEFEFAPASADEVAIAVLDSADDNTILEKWIVSLTPGTKNYEQTNIYCEDYINNSSSYILLYDDTTNSTEPASNEATALAGGVDGAPATGDVTTGYDMFENKDEVDIQMLLDGANCNSTVHGYMIDNICESRKDCIGILTCQKADVVAVANIATAISNLTTYVNTTLNKTSSWASFYGNWKYQYDSYADKYRWVPISGDVAGITAQTHYTRDPWFAPAFYNRGIMKNVSKLAINPNLGYRNTLYNSRINPIIDSPGDGVVVLGQKTMLTTPSSFNRLDVRWLFLVIEKAIAIAAKYFMGEKNTAFTRRQFKGVVEPYLRDIVGREGIEDFYVQCDENVNTAEVISRNEFRASIYVKPTMTAEFIIIEFVNVKQSIEFSEVIKKAA